MSDDIDRPRPAADDRPGLSLVSTSDPKPTRAKPDIPACPHLEILAAWSEVLPALPSHLPDQWRGSRADHLRARWRETAAQKAKDGKPWQGPADGVRYFRKLFAWIAQSEFLTGRAAQMRPGGRPFVAELEWVVNPTNWAKIHEGKYHQTIENRG
jgi:hypothetical protein